MSAVDVDTEPDKFETCLKRTMGPRAAGCCIPIYRILNFIWQYLVTPFLPLTDVASDIITVVTWYNWCQEGQQDFDCHWWILGVVFILLPICVMLVTIAVGMKKRLSVRRREHRCPAYTHEFPTSHMLCLNLG